MHTLRCGRLSEPGVSKRTLLLLAFCSSTPLALWAKLSVDIVSLTFPKTGETCTITNVLESPPVICTSSLVGVEQMHGRQHETY